MPTLRRKFWVSALIPFLFIMVIVAGLLTLEAIALILLLGAQVIAELQRNDNLGLPWHSDPDHTVGGG